MLNQKEQVLVVEMTKDGRAALSKGLFSPRYFSFFDDSVIYDSSYGIVNTEDKNSIENRILNNSLTFPCLNLLSDDLGSELGDSSIMSDYAPSWSIKLLNGKMNYNSTESNYHKKYFSFDTLLCHLAFKDKKNPSENIDISNDFILLDLEEINVEDDIKNFEIELIYYDDMEGSKKEKRLLFTKPKSNIVDDYIYSDDELPNNFFNVEIDEKYTSHYFDILVDDEIDTEYIINSGKNLSEVVTGLLNGINNTLMPNGINGIGPEGSSIIINPNGDIVKVSDEEDRPYTGTVCRLLCCP